jgi:lactate dehydrogenase-like 2-hydroxyacid dehydrogenase
MQRRPVFSDGEYGARLLIDTKALVKALKKGPIGGAGLDVYEEDVCFFEDWPAAAVKDDALARLLVFPNVIVIGREAFFPREALSAIATRRLSTSKIALNRTSCAMKSVTDAATRIARKKKSNDAGNFIIQF